ncbi:hypothetical protein WG66_014148 [Moniliophthora roreri]|nr:hypothetical protein WG66_014148 [Moniliophthora roreri]
MDETAKYSVLFLYIATELHELQHYLVPRLLPFVKKTPRLVDGMSTIKPNSGEAGFRFERHMLGYVPTAVWEGSNFGDPKQIVRLEGVIRRRENGFDNEYGWPLG